MISIQSHHAAISILEKVLENSIPFDEPALLFTSLGVSVDDDGKEVGCAMFFFKIGPDIYIVSLDESGGGEVQRLGVTESWTAFPTDDNEEEEANESFGFRPLGMGCQDVPSLLAAAADAGADWVIVEQDEPAKNMSRMESVKASIDYLKTLSY